MNREFNLESEESGIDAGSIDGRRDDDVDGVVGIQKDFK